MYSNVDGPRDYHTKQSNSERDKCYHLYVESKVWYKWTYLVAQTVKNLPAMQEPFVLFLDQEDPLEKGMAIHSSILAWRIPWTEEPGRLQSMGLQKVWHDWACNTHTYSTWNKNRLTDIENRLVVANMGKRWEREDWEFRINRCNYYIYDG